MNETTKKKTTWEEDRRQSYENIMRIKGKTREQLIAEVQRLQNELTTEHLVCTCIIMSGLRRGEVAKENDT